MTSQMLNELAWLFKIEAVHENASQRGDGGEAMRLFIISLELEDKARERRSEEFRELFADLDD